MIFKNRKEAGKLLAKKLDKYKGKKDLLILGVPRGGVVVAKEVANYLKAPLDVVVTRKISHPLNPEYAVAAVDEKGIITEFEHPAGGDGLHPRGVEEVKEIKRRLKEYRGTDTHPDFKDKICIIVDDGIATGLTTLSAIRFIKAKNPKRTVLSIPVMPADLVQELRSEVDELIYLDAPKIFYAVGQFYEDFPQTQDEEVKRILKNYKS